MAFLLDYSGEKTDLPADIFDDISDIVVAWIEVNAGNEMLKIVYNNGKRHLFSLYSTFQNCYDGEYDIIVNGKWVIDEKKWNSRTSSYSVFYDDEF